MIASGVVWALTSLFISMVVFSVYLAIFFFSIVIVFWGISLVISPITRIVKYGKPY